MTKIKLSLRIGLVGCVQEGTITLKEAGYEQDEWDAMTDKEKDKAMDEILQEWMWNYVDLCWKETKE